jgi:hypothetical protein
LDQQLGLVIQIRSLAAGPGQEPGDWIRRAFGLLAIRLDQRREVASLSPRVMQRNRRGASAIVP